MLNHHVNFYEKNKRTAKKARNPLSDLWSGSETRKVCFIGNTLDIAFFTGGGMGVMKNASGTYSLSNMFRESDNSNVGWNCLDGVMSKDCQYGAVYIKTAPYILFYKFDGTYYKRIPTPNWGYGNYFYKIAMSPDGTAFSIFTSEWPNSCLRVYDVSGTDMTKMNQTDKAATNLIYLR